ncbi:MAG TPA: DUF6765 family protein [Magnetospirillum sp.]|nr:DUF6765 family protein [Magnetospirillum sp.]
MQKDMHYYGTYCMARAAGMSRDKAQVMASAAQYVDDNVQRSPIEMRDGARLLRTPTAHHVTDEPSNINPNDQRDVWVPFHFLPGNEASDLGDSDYGERLKCRKDSEPARAMVQNVVARVATDTQGLERLGITAHVYADTFSHFGFSGVSSDRNAVISDSFRFPGANPELIEDLQGKWRGFAERFRAEAKVISSLKSWFAEKATAALGHGGVATYPDLPYLRWGFDYEHPTRLKDDRDNTANFLEACAALHELFCQAIAQQPEFGGGVAWPFAKIKATVTQILATQGDEDERSGAWRKAAQAGKLYAQAETIPDYLGDQWTRWLKEADGKVDSQTALDHPACRFHLAANAHRSWVLHELLPSRTLLVA